MKSGAIVAKAKAKYGKFLKEADYEALLKCTSVSEVVSYLKNNTHYRDVLAKVNEQEIHRAQAEDILKQNLFIDIASLCRYETGNNSAFSDYIIRDYEISLILHCIILINSKKSDTRYLNIPSFFISRLSFDVNMLGKAKDFGALLNALDGTEFKRTLIKFKPYKDKPIDLPSIENALINENYSLLIEGIKSGSDKKNRDEVLKFINRTIDFLNYVRIYRLKRYYNLSPSKIKSMLIPFGTISQSQLNTLCAADDYRDLHIKSKQMKIGRDIEKLSYAYPGEIGQRAKFFLSHRNMYLSDNASLVLISYSFLSQIELNNVITLIEGARYKVSEDKIRQVLLY